MRVNRYVLVSDPSDFEDGTAEIELELPVGAELIGNPRMSSKGLLIFAVVNGDVSDTETRTFLVVGNGVELPEGVSAMNFCGTEKIMGGPTFHVFNVTKVAA